MDKMKKKDEPNTKLGTHQIVRWFIASGHASAGFGVERVSNSVALLRRIPAARHAILQRFTQLFEEATRCCLDQQCMDYSSSAYGMNQEMNASIQIIASTLNEFLEKNNEAWAPILCEWSVESLGQISSIKQGSSISTSADHTNSKLNELVAFWLQAYPTRTLMAYGAYREEKLEFCRIDQGSESCMDSLLANSARYAPNFDWVVADIGSAFPTEIINRVLRTGFKDFVKQQWGQQPMEDDQPKLKSVMRILEHLATRHCEGVRKAMTELYQSPPASDGTGRIKVILYIMHLLSNSPLLVRVSTKAFLDLLDNANLNQLYTEFTKLPNHKSKLEMVCSLAVHLICQSSDGSYRLIHLFLQSTSSESNGEGGLDKPVKEIFSQIMCSLLQDLLRIAMRKGTSFSDRKENGVVTELKLHYRQLCKELLTNSSLKRQEWILTLMTIVSVRSSATPILSRLLTEITESTHLFLFLKLYMDVSGIMPGLLEQTLEHSFALVADEQLSHQQQLNLLTNIFRLLSRKVEASGSYEMENRVKKALWHHCEDLLFHICNVNPSSELAATSVDIITILLSNPDPLTLKKKILTLSQTLVFHFLHLLHLGKVNNDLPMGSCRQALVYLSSTPDSFALVCQSLLESCVSQANAVLFGRRLEEPIENEDGTLKMNDFCAEQNLSLLSQHRSYTASSAVVGSTAIVIETGLVGSGPKRKKSCPLSKATQISNNECISLLLHRCCCKTGSSGSMEGGTIHDTPGAFDSDKLDVLGINLFEAVTSCSPASLLHADILWPDAPFRKYTVERDLHIFTFLDEHPFIWSLLYLLANSPQSLWKCSVIVRSICGALLHHWESSRGTRAELSPCHLQHSVKVVEVLGKAQIIPSPLCYVGELFHHLTPYEVFVLLMAVWKFVHEHPLPYDFQCDSQKERDFFAEGIPLQPYLHTVHSVLHSNISQLGHLYSRFVPEKRA